jgi:hypothetical protein
LSKDIVEKGDGAKNSQRAHFLLIRAVHITMWISAATLPVCFRISSSLFGLVMLMPFCHTNWPVPNKNPCTGLQLEI